MQVQKIRVAANNGLVPAGAYLAAIAGKLEEINAREAALRDELDEEDRELEATYRKRSAARAEEHALM